MESPLKRIEAQIKSAMLAKDAFSLNILRMLKTALKNQEIEIKREVSEPEFLQTVLRMQKQRQDSVDQYQKAGQAERAESEAREIAFLQSYLPSALTESECAALIGEAIQKLGATGPKDMGRVMQTLKDSTQGRVDGKQLSEKVQAALKALST